MRDVTSVRQPLLQGHPLTSTPHATATTATNTTICATTAATTTPSYLPCRGGSRNDSDDRQKGPRGETSQEKGSSSRAEDLRVTADATVMAQRGVLIGDDGLQLGKGVFVFPRTTRSRLRLLHIQNRFLRMALFTLAAAWALWSLLLLSSDHRHALAVPTPGHQEGDHHDHHTFYTTRPCTANTFSHALPSFASVERVDTVTASGVYGEGTADLGFPSNATNLPPLCAVTVAVHNGSSNYRFALFLPTATQWNGRILTIGSYSFAGGINWPDMGQGPHYGFATLASDGGHNSSQDALDWVPTTPDKLADWGYRSLHGSIGLGKQLTQYYYSDSPIAFSYYSGCSTGGRQGLKEIQISPESFDGALVGAPAWDTSRLMPWATRIGAANLPLTANGHLDLAEFATLAAAALTQCDHLDGHNDSIISLPEQCVLDWAPITCGTSPLGASCLSDEQVVTAKYLYSDAFTSNGDFIHSGFSLGSEDLWYVYLAYGDESDFDTRYERFWLYNDTAWNWTQYSDKTFYDSLKADLGNATADAYDISAYRDRGGKVLLYQGLADGVVMPRMTTYYYNQTREAMNLTLASDPEKNNNKRDRHNKNAKDDGSIQDFFRYFQVPGMQHCFASPTEVAAPWMFAAPGQATLLLQDYHFGEGWGVPNQPPNATHDALLALMAWVENATAPTSIVATVWNGDGSVNRTRPLCVYPQEAVYKGVGSLNVADSWHCQ